MAEEKCPTCEQPRYATRLHTLPPDIASLVHYYTKPVPYYTLGPKENYDDLYPIPNEGQDERPWNLCIYRGNKLKLSHVVWNHELVRIRRNAAPLTANLKTVQHQAIERFMAAGPQAPPGTTTQKYEVFLSDNCWPGGRLFYAIMQDDAIYVHSNGEENRTITTFKRETYFECFAGLLKELYKLLWEEEF